MAHCDANDTMAIRTIFRVRDLKVPNGNEFLPSRYILQQ